MVKCAQKILHFSKPHKLLTSTIFGFVLCCTIDNLYCKVNYEIIHTCMFGTFQIVIEINGQCNHYLAQRMPVPGQFINSSSWLYWCFESVRL